MKKADKVIGFIALIFSLFIIEESLRMPQEGGAFEPGIKFLPFWLGVVMAILSVLLMVNAWRKSREASKKKLMPNRRALLSIALIIVGLTVYIALLETVGFLIMTVLFNVFLLGAVMRASWKMTLGVGFGTSVALYVLFQILLEVNLPKNVFGF